MRITMEPSGERWEGLIRAWWDVGDEARIAARRAAGLAPDRPIVMTGHQAEMWHPGILAKFLAADGLACCLGGATAWLIADQDDNEGAVLSVPVRDERGVLGVERVWIGTEGAKGVPTGARSAASTERAELKGRAALESVERGLGEIGAAVDGARGEPTLAKQIAAALQRLGSRWLREVPLVLATGLSESDTFRELVERMRADPEGAVRAYNAAASESLEAGVGGLEVSGGRVELPLWRVRAGVARERVHADQLDTIPAPELAPRALLMTAIVRMALCDLFIHGTGGAAYDRVTERWIGAWLGRPLAPAVMATADVLLPLEEAEVEHADVARAVWRAHHARHDPGEVGLDALAREKKALVERIVAEKSAGRDPAPAFRALQEMLAKYRTDEGARLDAVEAEAGRLAQALASRHIAHDRAWAFPLHDPARIDALRDEVVRRVCARAAKPCCC